MVDLSSLLIYMLDHVAENKCIFCCLTISKYSVSKKIKFCYQNLYKNECTGNSSTSEEPVKLLCSLAIQADVIELSSGLAEKNFWL